MKQLKRLDATPKDPYFRALKSRLRHVALSQGAFDELRKALPDHVVVEDDCALIAQPYQGMISLQYGFPGSDSFARQFPSMFANLLPALSLDEAPMGIRFRLTDAPSRPFVEPVLVAHAFEVMRDWLRMELRELPIDASTADPIAEGFSLRDARVEDAEAIATLDAIAFPSSWLTAGIVRDSVGQGALRVLEDTATHRAVGFLRLRTEDALTGYISDLALHPEYQGRGLGEALMHWALGRFRDGGLQSAALTVSTDNGPAIALYRKLGFTAGEAGIDYRRPIDEDEVRQFLDRKRASHITIRKRY